jgi:hypothetical protein
LRVSSTRSRKRRSRDVLIARVNPVLKAESPTLNPSSRQLAEQLRTGEHRLHNADLRRAYGLSRVTATARSEIARELRQAGLEVLSDPANEPLVVRKTAPGQARALGVVRPWWKRPWAITIAGLIALFLLIGGLSDDDSTTKAGTQSPRTTSVAATDDASAAGRAAACLELHRRRREG